MWNNNNCLWIILIILLIGCWGNGTCGSSCGCAGGSGLLLRQFLRLLLLRLHRACGGARWRPSPYVRSSGSTRVHTSRWISSGGRTAPSRPQSTRLHPSKSATRRAFSPAAAEILLVRLVDVGLRAGALLPLTAQRRGKFRRQVQIEDKIGPGQAHQIVFKVKEPPEIVPARPVRQLSRLVYGVGGGIPVRDHKPPLLVPLAPVLYIRRVPVHGVKRGGGIGVHSAGVCSKGPAQVHPHQHGGVLVVPGKGQLPHGMPPPLQRLHQKPGLGGLAGAVGPLEHDELSPHFLFPLSAAAWTRNSGSFTIRPMRRGSRHSR